MKARGGPREFKGLRADRARIEGFWFARRGSDQLDAHVVKGVDEDDEPLGLVAFAWPKRGDAVEHNCVKALGDLKIVGGAERAPAERVEVETRCAVDRLRHVEAAPQKLDPGRLALVLAGQRAECGVERGVRLRANRRIIDRRARELLKP